MKYKGYLILGALAMTALSRGAYSLYGRYKGLKTSEKRLETYETYFNLLKHLVIDKYEKRNITAFFHDNNYRNIAVYGLGSFGEILGNELEVSDINIVCFIDKNAGESVVETTNIPLYSPEEYDFASNDIDAIIVTAPMYFDEIEQDLIDYGVSVPIVSISDVILHI